MDAKRMKEQHRDLVQVDVTEVEPSAEWMVSEADVGADEVGAVQSGDHCFVAFWRKAGVKGPGNVHQTVILRMDPDEVRGMWPKAKGQPVPSNKLDMAALLYIDAHRDEIMAEVRKANSEVRTGKREIFVVHPGQQS